MTLPKRRILRAQKKEKTKSSNLLFKILIPLVIVLVLALFLKINTKYWNGKDKVSFVFRQSSGDVAVSVLDPKLNEMTTLTIPGDTQVDVARSYGTLRIKNVWQLALNEKLNGKLLSETVARNFLFPVNLWSDSDAVNIKDADFFGVLKFVVFPKSTNIPVGDRLSMAIFTLKLRALNKTEIDLGKSQFLHKEKLSDGQTGYVLVGTISERLSVYFSDNQISEKGMRVSIVDGTGKFGEAQIVGEILEVMGGKVISIDKGDVLPDTDCSVVGKDSAIVKKISKLFTCSYTVGGDIELQITIGGKFAKRF